MKIALKKCFYAGVCYSSFHFFMYVILNIGYFVIIEIMLCIHLSYTITERSHNKHILKSLKRKKEKKFTYFKTREQ